MRTDYVLYVIAVICFIIAGYTAVARYTEYMTNTLIVIVLAIIGVIFIWGGYSLRPQTRVVMRTEPSMPPTKAAMEEQPVKPAPEPEPTPAPETMPSSEITEETKTEELPPPEVPPETPPETPAETPSKTSTETKKPVRKRREKKKTE